LEADAHLIEIFNSVKQFCNRCLAHPKYSTLLHPLIPAPITYNTPYLPLCFHDLNFKINRSLTKSFKPRYHFPSPGPPKR